MTELQILPAVDVQGGQAVQLVQGVAGSEKTFGDPLEAALRWQEQGARWLHVVDLDAAFGRGSNADVLARIVNETDIQVELSGGIRDDESLRRALDTGATRCNVGTAAIENPEWCEQIIAEFGERVAIGLDIRDGRLAARGWTSQGGDAFEALRRFTDAGCARFVVTDVASDGTLTGPNLDLLRKVCEQTTAKVVASGGVSNLDDIRALTRLDVEGVIVGTALYVGNLRLPDALAVARGEEPSS